MKAYRDTEDPTSIQPAPRQATLMAGHQARNREQPELVNLYNDVISIHNRQKRKEMVALREGRSPDYTGFEKELYEVLNKLVEKLRKNGLSDEQLPWLPDGEHLDSSIKYSHEYSMRALHASRRCSDTQPPELPGGSNHPISDNGALDLAPFPTSPSATISTPITLPSPRSSIRSNLIGTPPSTPPDQYNPLHETTYIYSNLPPPALDIYKAIL
jgi:hypothetical protein